MTSRRDSAVQGHVKPYEHDPFFRSKEDLEHFLKGNATMPQWFLGLCSFPIIAACLEVPCCCPLSSYCSLPRGLICSLPRVPRKQTLRPKFPILVFFWHQLYHTPLLSKILELGDFFCERSNKMKLTVDPALAKMSGEPSIWTDGTAKTC